MARMLFLLGLLFGGCDMNLINLPPGALGGQSPIVPNPSGPSRTGFGLDTALFNIAATDNEPEMVTVAFSAMAPTNFNDRVAGPLVGILNFGGGNGRNMRLEFDVPLQQQSPMQTPGLGAVADCNAAVIVSVPASQIYAGMRHDGNLMPPSGTNSLGSVVSNAVPVIGSAHVALGNRSTSSSKLWRTVWVSYDGGGGGIPNGGSQTVSIPAFARSVRVIRSNSALSMSIFINGGGNLNTIDGPYAVAAGAQSPVIDLSGFATQIVINNTGGGAPMDRVACIFDVGF